MNKAFTKETDHDIEDEESCGSLLPTGVKNYITPGGLAKLRAEFDKLMNDERPKLTQVIAWAASNGDRSENADYIYGKRRLREIDRRIRFLTKRIESAEVIDPTKQKNTAQVFFGATVTVGDEEGVEKTYVIVGVDEIDLARNHISWISPLARALLKSREGDVVTFQSPKGKRELEVLRIAYLPLHTTAKKHE